MTTLALSRSRGCSLVDGYCLIETSKSDLTPAGCTNWPMLVAYIQDRPRLSCPLAPGWTKTRWPAGLPSHVRVSSSSATAPSAPAARRPRVPLRFSAGAGCSGGDGGPWGLHLLPFLSGLIPVNFIDHTKRPVKQLPQGPVCLICCLQTMAIQQ